MIILYVDSQPATREQRVSPFLLKGLDVHEAASPEEALSLLAGLDQLDVLVTEAIFDDGQIGKVIAEAAFAKFPQVRVIYTSRYLLDGYESHYDKTHIIYEPVRESLLISEVLGFCPVDYEDATASQPLQVTAVDDESRVQSVVVAEEDFYDAPQILAPGTILDNYLIEERIYSEEKTETYRAIQLGIDREVALVLMRPERLFDVGALADFKERQKVKASVSHPRVAPLFEAAQKDKYYFYTRELPHGKSLQQLQLERKRFSEKGLAELISYIAEAMSVGVEMGYHYRMPSVRDIFVDEEGVASIVNVFRPPSAMERNQQADTHRLLGMLRAFAEGPRARHLLEDLFQERHDWKSLKERGDELQEEFRERSLLKRADSREMRDIEAAQSRNSSWKAYLIFFVLASILVGAIVMRNKMENPTSERPIVAKLVEVPAGFFIFGKGEKRQTPAFWIDAYEVTISQYAEFLNHLEDQPTAQPNYDHPKQPASKVSHRPKLWDTYYAAAKSRGLFNDQPLSLNSPVTFVDWWDAYAYAQWKGHRLPSEEEWEKAARGLSGLIYPWGEEMEIGNANLGSDYLSDGSGGKRDGFNFTAPVNKTEKDSSPYGAFGMAGNVSEWTSTWAVHPDFPDLEIPVVKGGNFTSKVSQSLLTGRTFSESAEEASRLRGFRTISDKAPAVTKEPVKKK